MNIFDPVTYSLDENKFLLSHVGEPPMLALETVPQGVNPRAIRPVLERIYELVEIERHSGRQWCGLAPIKESIEIYLMNQMKWSEDRRRGAPRFPSMHSFDSKGRPHRSGVGSDAGTVTTYFLPTGERAKFAVELIPSGIDAWKPEWAKGTDKPEKGLKVETENRRITCELCGHTESFKPESRSSFNAARARMSKHLRTTTIDVDDHRELHTNEFGG